MGPPACHSTHVEVRRQPSSRIQLGSSDSPYPLSRLSSPTCLIFILCVQSCFILMMSLMAFQIQSHSKLEFLCRNLGVENTPLLKQAQRMWGDPVLE